MRYFIFATYVFSTLVLASTPAFERIDIQNSIKEEMLAVRGRKEASEALLVYKEARLKRLETLYQKNAASLSELELARAERNATLGLIGWMKEEENSNQLRLNLLAYMNKPKDQIKPEVIAEMSKAVEDARCRKSVHRRNHFSAYVDFYTRESKRNERLLKNNAVSLENYELTESRRLENVALEKTWNEFLQSCPSN